jgi:hypothetical protein
MSNIQVLERSELFFEIIDIILYPPNVSARVRSEQSEQPTSNVFSLSLRRLSLPTRSATYVSCRDMRCSR